ncbi:MAG: signal recognition particle-docking protein FtsY [Bdellovibrionales bacterium]|nr:signal recognition particle-docking protein FtsY [Bdellovibrionales bacterium]
MELEILLAIGAAIVAISGVGFVFLRKPQKAKTPHPPLKGAEGTLEKTSRKDYKSLEDALLKTKESFWGRMSQRLSGKSSLNKSDLEDLEEILYTSDLGPKTVDHLISKVSMAMGDESTVAALHESLKLELNKIFSEVNGDLQKLKTKDNMTVWMVVGVNGAGKTTTIGKLASQQVALGKKVMIAAGDTFRAAADAQLKVWAERAQVEIFSPEGIKDPSAVAFDAIKKAEANSFDLVIIDTAGRLHTQKNLMEELKKMKRVMDKALPGAPHETLLVLDANSGQNALMQTEQFHGALDVTGVILTKMDGSAKGGVAVGIACEHQLPIKMIGVGEKIEDLRPFEPQAFVDSIL